MPTYVYRREDGSTFEVQQRITEDPLQVCPDTGQKVERVITGTAGLIFKGSGFYLTDYARDGGQKNGATESTSKEASNGKADSGSGEKKAEKSAGATSKSES